MTRRPHPDTRVAVIHNLPSPYRFPLFEALAREVDLRVFFLASGAPNRTWRRPERLGFAAEWPRPLSIRLPGKEYRGLLANPSLLPALRRFRPDVVVLGGYDSVSTLATLAYCRLTGAPAVLWSGSTALERTNRTGLKERAKRGIVRSCQAYVAYGSRARDYLVSLGARPERIAIAPNTVDIAWFEERARRLDPPTERRRFGLAPDLPVVLFAGQLIDRKEPLALANSLGELREAAVNAQLFVVGDGPLRSEIEGRCRSLGVPVVFAGALDLEAMPSCYVAADLLVLPSREEIWGLVANEAMSCSRPVLISHTCGAATDLVEHGVTGRIFRTGHPEALVASLRDMLGGKDDLGAMGTAAHKKVQEFSIARAAEGFLEGISLALGGRAG